LGRLKKKKKLGTRLKPQHNLQLLRGGICQNQALSLEEHSNLAKKFAQ